MLTISSSELRRKVKKYFDAVERGETVHVKRRKKVVARIVPVENETHHSWEKPALRLVIPGVKLSKIISEDREEPSK